MELSMENEVKTKNHRKVNNPPVTAYSKSSYSIYSITKVLSTCLPSSCNFTI